MTIDITNALQSLRPGAEWVLRGNEYAGLEWLDTKQAKPTEAEVNAEIAHLSAEQPLKDCTAEAKNRIAKTDWSVLSDVGLVNVAEFVEYRAILRYLILNPVADPVWPVEPQPAWEAK